MAHTIRQIFRSGKFLVGFVIFTTILLITIIYPLIIKNPPLEIIAQGSFFPPGIYLSTLDGINTAAKYNLNLESAALKRLQSKLNETDRQKMKVWLVKAGIPEAQIDTTNTAALLQLWATTYDAKRNIPGLTNADRNYYVRLNNTLNSLVNNNGVIIAQQNDTSGTLDQVGTVGGNDYVNMNDLPNVKVLPLGTDNFGRDVLTELVQATGVSLQIGLIAGTLATLIGLTLGLFSGYVGGIVDDVIMFFTNLFTVIPGIVLLILISFSIGQDKRGPTTIAIVIGLTSWYWTTRSVRAQVISLRNRDHVNLSKLSGHSISYIILHDILPYIASYVVMALVLQISSGILAEAGLSVLGLGPRTTEVATLGLMMNWALIYQAHILGKWWALLPVIFVIALISFSLNLMNTGLDQVFNPTLRS